MPNMNVPGRVSIIMPVYNGDEYIGNAISSILSQTYQDLELIVVNDGSTDNTVSIVMDMLIDSKIKWRLYGTRGPSAYNPMTMAHTFFAGVARSTGEFYSVHSCDNISHADKFATLVSAIGDNIGSYSSFYRINGYDIFNPYDMQIHMGIGGNANDVLDKYSMDPSPTNLIRIVTDTAIIRKEGYLRPRCNIPVVRDGGPDNEFARILAAFTIGDFVHVDRPLTLFRVNTGSNVKVGKSDWMEARLFEIGYNMDDVLGIGGKYNYNKGRIPELCERVRCRRDA